MCFSCCLHCAEAKSNRTVVGVYVMWGKKTTKSMNLHSGIIYLDVKHT